jgi:hypothetical protein
MSLSWPFKDPDEVLDYSIDWSGRLSGDDTISLSVWTVPAGITNEEEDKSGRDDHAVAVGRHRRQTYSFLNRVTTVGGRVMDQTVTLKIKSK